MKYKSMRYRRWILCLLAVAWCGITQADLSTLEKLQSMDWDSNDWLDVGYDLVLMGDEAVLFLIETLTTESQAARQRDLYSEYVRGRAISLLRGYCPDTRALPVLTTLFLHDTEQRLRQNAADAIAEIDPEYARQLMGKYLKADAETQDIAFSVLEGLGDKRAAAMWVPVLVSRLENPETRRSAALRLAKFKDKRAVPVLLNMLNDKELEIYNKKKAAFALVELKSKRAVPFLLDMLDDKESSSYTKEQVLNRLAPLGDERVIPVLLNRLAGPRQWWDVAHVLSQFGPAIVPPLLEIWKQTDSQEIRDRIAGVLDDIHPPELASVYGQIYFETEDYRLRKAMLYALSNMGVLGFEHLLKVAKQKPDDRVWQCLSTYNGEAIVDAVAELALDELYPHRSAAIDTLGSFGKLWKKEIAKHIPPLLVDADPAVQISTMYLIQELEMTEFWKVEEISNHVSQLLSNADPGVKFRTIRLIKHLKMIEMMPTVQKLTQSTDARIKKAAHNVLAALLEAEPLKLEIEMNRPRYDYGQSIDLTYRITNVSPHPIEIPTTGISRIDIGSGSPVAPVIQQPDGSFAAPRGSIVCGVFPSENYQTLQPGGEFTITIPIVGRKPHLPLPVQSPDGVSVIFLSLDPVYWLYQPGRYTIHLRVHLDLRGIIIHVSGFESFKPMAWTGMLTSPQVHFDIAPPTAEQLNAMLALINAKPNTEASRVEAMKACHQLGELRRSEAIPALKKLALVYSDGDHDIREVALSALAKFSSRDLTPMWIEMLSNRGYAYRCALEAFVKSKDPRAIEPLRRIIFRAGSEATDAALTLQKLGDDSGVEWYRTIAWRKLQHRDKETRKNGIRILRRLQPRSNERRSKYYQRPDPHQPPDPQRVLTDAWFSAMINDRQIALNWLAAGAKAVASTDVERLLKHSDPAIQRAAAYELASFGNASGVYLIQPDLYADDAQTRAKARVALLRARSE